MKIADEKAMIDRAQLRKMLEGFRLSKTKERDIEIAQDLAELFRKKSWLRNVFLPFGMNRFDGAVKELDGLDFGSEDYINKKNEVRTMAETLERKLYSLKNLGRAAVLAGGLALTAGSFPAYSQEATTQVEQKPFVMPSDDVLKQYMKTPVNELLKDIAVPVDNNNYQREVFGSDRPVMVLLYGDGDFSRGLGALVKVLNEEFSQIKICTYYCNYRDGDRSKRDMDQLIDRLRAKNYPIKVLPLLVFYDNDGGKVEMEKGDGTTMNADGGPRSLSELKKFLRYYEENMKYILD